MSKTPADKSIDEQTFEALEDALNISVDDDDLDGLDDISIEELEHKVSNAARELKNAGASKPAAPEASLSEPRPKGPGESTAPRVAAPPFTPAGSLAPANDDSRKNTAGLLRALEIRSSRGALRNATIISLLWAIGGIGLANLLLAPGIWEIRSVSDLLAMPAVVGFLVAIIVPILIFFAFSIMMARAREMRSAARSMAEVALRLAEPENIAGDRILSVGQAVRREVSAMNEGIERTIARASELETLVHSEVNALERSYTDNEVRVRGLVQELGNERDAIVTHAERIRASITGAHEQLRSDLSQAGDDLTNRLSTSGQAVAQLLDTRAAQLQNQTSEVSEAIENLLASRTQGLLDTLKTSGQDLTDEFDTRIEILRAQLEQRGKALLNEFETRASSLDANTEKLNAALSERARELNETLIARTREISESIGVGQQAIAGGLEDTLRRAAAVRPGSLHYVPAPRNS